MVVVVVGVVVGGGGGGRSDVVGYQMNVVKSLTTKARENYARIRASHGWC